jgi:hypothetical protein
MPTVTGTAKAATTAYNDKNWDKVKSAFAENGIYDEKGTSRRVQGVGKIIEVWQGWAKAIPDSKATFVGEYASGDTAIIGRLEGHAHGHTANGDGHHRAIE